MSADSVVIVGLARTPMGAFQGAFSTVTAPQLGSAAIKAALEEAKIGGSDVDQVLMGCVLPAGQGQAPARQAALGADLPISAEATTVNKMCGSGMQAAIMAHDAIKAGSIDVAVAGGMESMTNAPYLLPKARGGMRMGDQQVVDSMMYDGLTDAYAGGAMGVFADEIASEYQFTREQQDAYAIESVRRAQAAEAGGKFDREMTSVTVKGRKGDTIVEKADSGELKDLGEIEAIYSSSTKKVREKALLPFKARVFDELNGAKFSNEKAARLFRLMKEGYLEAIK